MSSLTIRKGAARWDATLRSGGQSTTFDFRTMTPAQRAEWYTAFMSSVRTKYGRGT